MNNKFRLPNAVTIMGRSSSITNSFINGIIPIIKPTLNDIEMALSILEQNHENILCVYCGDSMSEWDHLNPLVRNKESTGYITEIGNLVPCCGKCNQSKGNKNWKEWMNGDAKLSPKSRGIKNIKERIIILERYEKWKEIKPIDLPELVGIELWEKHWQNYEEVIEKMKSAQETMNEIKLKILQSRSESITKSKNNPNKILKIKNEYSLIRDINTIGKSTFIKYLDMFKSSDKSRQEIINIMRKSENYSENTLNTKVSIGIKICRDNNIKEALEIIIKAKNITDSLRLKAKELLVINSGF